MKPSLTILALGVASCLQGTLMAQVWSDDFSAPHDYLAAGVAGTIWSGLQYGGDAVLTAANADLANPGRLTLTSRLGNWENNDNDGLLLYVGEVTGNWIAEVEIPASDNPSWHSMGLMARVPNAADAGAGEDWVAAMFFNQFSVNTTMRSTDDGASTAPGGGPVHRFLRLEKSGDQFSVRSKATAEEDWSLRHTITRADMGSLPLQVGIWHATYSANDGTAQFDNFSLTLLRGPTITGQPQPAKSLVGGTASFSVGATGIEPLEYQWQHAGTNLPGAIDATLTLTDVQLEDGGGYAVTVTDADGETLSEETTLTVYASGQLFQDDFETFHDYSGGEVTGTIWDGVLNAGALEPGADTTGGVLHWPNAGEGWENPAVGWTNAPLLYKQVDGNFDVEVYLPFVAAVDWSDGGIIARVAEPTGAENWVSAKFFGPANSPAARWVTNGVYQQSGGFTAGNRYLRLERRGSRFYFYSKALAGADWTLGHTLDAPTVTGPLQVGLWHGTFSANAADRQFDNFSLYIPAGPVITNQPPAEQLVLAGTNLTLTVGVQGTGTIQYQWKHAGTNLPGATGPSLELLDIQPADAGEYVVEVTDDGGSVVSDPARLTVWAALGVLTDDFERYHDFSSGNVAGTIWSGIVNPQNLDPGSDTADGVLHWRNTGDGWENANASGPFLHTLVEGDFDAEVEIAGVDYVQWSDGGLMARVPDVADAGAGEDWVSAMMFGVNEVDGWAQQNRMRSTDDGTSVSLWTSGVFGHRFLRLQRIGGTFNFFTKAAAEDPWGLRESVTRTDLPAQLQVGVQHGTFVANAADRRYDNFRIAGPQVPSQLRWTASTGELALNWEGVNLRLEGNSSLADPNGWTELTDGQANQATVPMDGVAQFFRLRTP